MINVLPAGIAAFLISLGLTEVLRRFCSERAMLDRPNGERWHRTPRPRLGGVAIFAAVLASLALYAPAHAHRQWQALVLGGAFVFAWGLVDDLRPLPRAVKFLLLILTGFVPLVFGVVFPAPVPAWSVVLTVAWVTGITNAMNWLDNMDGVSAGVAVLTAATLATISSASGGGLSVVLASAVAGAALGFLVRNFPPAKIFMGDCGSGTLGYLLAVGTLIVVSEPAFPAAHPLLTAAFALGVPILDMLLVAVQRVLHGRSIFTGGKDHLSHRLVALGLSEREVVAVMYTLAVATCSVAMLTFVGAGIAWLFAMIAGIALAGSLAIAGSFAHVYQRPSVLLSWRRAAARVPAMSVLESALLIAALGLVYRPVLASLFGQWQTDPEYSHGPLIPLVAGYLLWQRRDQFRRCVSRPSPLGFVLILAGGMLLILGEAAVVGYLMRVSLLVVVAGLILFLSGPRALRLAALPLAYLLFMIPLPYIVFDRVTLPLQFLASNLATGALDLTGVPVHQDGNVITLTSGQLGVTEACSGIRSILALGAIGTAYALFAFPDWRRRVIVMASAIPIAIVTNAARVAVTGILADGLGLQTAMHFYHTFSGLAIFALAALLLALLGRLLVHLPAASGGGLHAQRA